MRYLNVRRGGFLALANLLLSFPGHRFRLFVFRRLAANVVGQRTTIERSCRVTGRGGVVIGSGCNINRGVLLDGRGRLTIGDTVNVSQEVMLLTAQHDVSSAKFEATDAPVVVASRCWIATRALVLPGTELGEGVVVAAGAVVKGSIASGEIVGGVPARTIGTRDPAAQTYLPEYRRWFQ